MKDHQAKVTGVWHYGSYVNSCPILTIWMFICMLELKGSQRDGRTLHYMNFVALNSKPSVMPRSPKPELYDIESCLLFGKVYWRRLRAVDRAGVKVVLCGV